MVFDVLIVVLVLVVVVEVVESIVGVVESGDGWEEPEPLSLRESLYFRLLEFDINCG